MARGAPGRDDSAAQLDTLRALNQQPAAILIGWTPRGLRDSDAPRKRDGTYDGPKLVEWAIARAGGEKGDADPLLAGGSNSPALEEYRRQKAREAKRNNELAEELIVTTETVGKAIGEIFGVFRARAQAIEALYGAEVGAAVRNMCDEAFGKTESKMTAKKALKAEPA